MSHSLPLTTRMGMVTSGNFAGVREQNSAFLDRFGFTLRFEYLPAVDEAALIVKRTGLTPKAADILG
jgi:MoxR-like ATPase